MKMVLDAEATREVVAQALPALLEAMREAAAELSALEAERPLSVAEAAGALGVSEDTIRRQVSAGLLRRVPGCGSRVLVTRRSVRVLQEGNL